MSLLEDVSNIIDRIERLHINDPTIAKYWAELSELLIECESDTIELFDNLDEPNKIDNISSVFEEISRGLQSSAFIQCLERLEKKFPDLLLVHMVGAAREALIDG